MLTFDQLLLAKGKKPAKPSPFKATAAKVAAEGKAYRIPGMKDSGRWHDPKEGVRMVAVSDDEGMRLDYPCNVEFSKLQIDNYVREFCNMNHLKH